MPAASFTVDPTSLGLGFGLAGITVSVVIALLSRIGDSSRALPFWAAASLSLTMGLEFGFLQDALPQGIGLLIANPLSVLGACLFLAGVRTMVGDPVQPGQLMLISMVSAVTSVLFVLVWPQVTGRVLSQLACLTVVTWLNTGVLRRLDHGYFHFPAKFLLITNAVLFAFYIVRGVTVVILGDSISASGGPGTKAIVFVISGLLILSYLKGILLICFAEKQTLLRRLATHDALTGVFNRLGLRDALTQWPDGHPGTVTVFDIDHFKQVNDGFGHETGDIVLKTFAAALQANCPAGSVVARLGGDEFCVVEKGVPQTLAGEWIRNLQDQLPTRLELACPTPLACQVSHGSAHFTRIADEFSTALHSADRALYRSKSARLPLD